MASTTRAERESVQAAYGAAKVRWELRHGHVFAFKADRLLFRCSAKDLQSVEDVARFIYQHRDRKYQWLSREAIADMLRFLTECPGGWPVTSTGNSAPNPK